MSLTLDRRSFLVGSAVLAATFPAPAPAQNKPIRIGLLTVKTGPLAQGGIQMEQGTIRFLKDRNYTLAGRKVELVVGDGDDALELQLFRGVVGQGVHVL